jgi:4-diphosphocytidyl-2-C-methyl-D-erythritol kinase
MERFPARAPLVEPAPAKINLTLEVRGRRGDGYHELESLVAFARVGDRLRLVPGETLALDLRGPLAAALDGAGDNLVLKAARELAARIEGLTLGRFELWKRLPVAAGVGGGSSDAAAALRLMARVNALRPDDPRLAEAACATGADVPVCMQARARLVRGIGEDLSDPLDLPKLSAVLVNPAVALATKDVFGAFSARAAPRTRDAIPGSPALHAAAIPRDRDELVSLLRARDNDLEEAAISLAAVVAELLAELRALPACELARMSGSGATCFAIFRTARAALAAARALRAAHPRWWVCATVLG